MIERNYVEIVIFRMNIDRCIQLAEVEYVSTLSIIAQNTTSYRVLGNFKFQMQYNADRQTIILDKKTDILDGSMTARLLQVRQAY